MSLKGKHIVLGVTGGIAAYKACDIASRLRKKGAHVHVIMTEHACEFVRPLTFETLTNEPVVTDMFRRDKPWEVEHVSLAKLADLFIIAPATANIMAKTAAGIADDMLSTTILAARCPMLFAPAMNSAMWLNPVTQRNLSLLKDMGIGFVGPASGNLACGDQDGLFAPNEAFRDFLRDKGFAVEWVVGEGYGHEWRFWNREVEAFLDWIPRTDAYADKPHKV